MFEAILIVCASSFALEVDRKNCITLNDSYGPFRTEENCYIRTQQIADDILYGDMNEPIFYILKEPDLVFVEQFCEKTNDVPI